MDRSRPENRTFLQFGPIFCPRFLLLMFGFLHRRELAFHLRKSSFFSAPISFFIRLNFIFIISPNSFFVLSHGLFFLPVAPDEPRHIWLHCEARPQQVQPFWHAACTRQQHTLRQAHSQPRLGSKHTSHEAAFRHARRKPRSTAFEASPVFDFEALPEAVEAWPEWSA